MTDRDSQLSSPDHSVGKKDRHHVFSSLAAQEIQHLVTSHQTPQDLEHSSNRKTPTVVRPSASASRGQSDEELGESQGDEGGDTRKKKLTKGQVRELERIFQAGYTGAPSGRNLVAAELKISERQVAIWFQNRRARQRSKQMQQEFEMLKRDFRLVLLDNQQLRQEVSDLHCQLAGQVLVRVPALKDDAALLTFPTGGARPEPSESILDPPDSRWQQALMQARLSNPPVPNATVAERFPAHRESAAHLDSQPLPPAKKARLEPLPNDFPRNEGVQPLVASSAVVLSNVIQSVQQQLGPHGMEAMHDMLRSHEGSGLSRRNVA